MSTSKPTKIRTLHWTHGLRTSSRAADDRGPISRDVLALPEAH